MVSKTDINIFGLSKSNRRLFKRVKKYTDKLLDIYYTDLDLYQIVSEYLLQFTSVDFSGHTLKYVILAIIYIVIRQKDLPYTLDDLIEIVKPPKLNISTKSAITNEFNYIIFNFEINLPSYNYNPLITRYINQLKISKTIEKKVKMIIEEEYTTFFQRKPTIVIAGTIYFVLKNLYKDNNNITQSQIANCCNVTRPSLRGVYKYLETKYNKGKRWFNSNE